MKTLEGIDREIALLWQLGFSKLKIEEKLNVTQNSVIGKIFRWRKRGILIDGQVLRSGPNKSVDVDKTYNHIKLEGGSKPAIQSICPVTLKTVEPIFTEIDPIDDLFPSEEDVLESVVELAVSKTIFIAEGNDRPFANLFERADDGCVALVDYAADETLYCNQLVAKGSYCGTHHAAFFVPHEPRVRQRLRRL